MTIGRTHVLILESDPATRAQAAQRLRRNGFAVKAVSSFADAVAYLERLSMPKRHAGESADAPKNPHAAALGRLGGRKGGETRAAVLSAKRRREIARKAARARWGKHRAA